MSRQQRPVLMLGILRLCRSPRRGCRPRADARLAVANLLWQHYTG